jgi:hypothetical protein
MFKKDEASQNRKKNIQYLINLWKQEMEVYLQFTGFKH